MKDCPRTSSWLDCATPNLSSPWPFFVLDLKAYREHAVPSLRTTVFKRDLQGDRKAQGERADHAAPMMRKAAPKQIGRKGFRQICFLFPTGVHAGAEVEKRICRALWRGRCIRSRAGEAARLGLPGWPCGRSHPRGRLAVLAAAGGLRAAALKLRHRRTKSKGSDEIRIVSAAAPVDAPLCWQLTDKGLRVASQLAAASEPT